ncbi:MAG: DUF1887 family protein, partial [Lentisphaeria bacterium]|nr:DUF1887 family protein [Lentisphaeria bacterium]
LEKHFLNGKRKMPKVQAHLRHLAADPLPPAPSPAVEASLAAAARAGFLVRGPDGGYRPNCGPDYGLLERLATILAGGWLELYVADLMTANPQRFADVRWSVEAQDKAIGETDVVAVDRESAALHLISCKTSVMGIKPLEHLEALSQRRHDMGGAFAKATLAVFRDPARQADQIRRWGRLLQVDVAFGDEIASRLGPRHP